MHGTTLALGVAMLPPGQFGHHALGIHAAGQHVAVVAVAGDHLITALDRHLHPDDDRLLPNIEMAEAADQAHPVKLTGLLLEAADEQHVTEGTQLLLLVEIRHYRRWFNRSARCCGLSG